MRVPSACRHGAIVLIQSAAFLWGLGCWSLLSSGIGLAQSQKEIAALAFGEEEAKQAALRVFQDEQFWWKRRSQVETSNFVQEMLRVVYRWTLEPLFEAIEAFFQWLGDRLFWQSGFSGTGDWSGGIPYLLVVVAFLGLLIGWKLWSNRHRLQPDRREEIALPEFKLPQAERLIQDAQASLAQGDLKSAIRFAFLSLIAWLQNAGRLQFDPSRSNREYLRDLRRWPELVDQFRIAADPFERCWYGGQNLQPGEVAAVIEQCRIRVLALEERE